MDSHLTEMEPGAGTSEDALEFHRSSNGDRWFLRRGERKAPVVRHVPNAASAGAVSEWAVGAFLSSERCGPEHDALVELLAGLVPPATGSAQPRSGLAASHPRRAGLPEPHAQVGADGLLLAVTRVCTFAQERRLTNASGFFFQQGTRLFLVTSRHVMIDVSGEHFPDRLEIEFHVDAENLAAAAWLSVPLYTAGHPLWRQGTDDGGEIDVAVIELDRAALPSGAKFHAFGPGHLPRSGDVMPIGASLLIVGFPLGFHDSLHHLPVVRQGVLASAFGLRFQGKGCFVTDARTHRGTSGAPVVLSAPSEGRKPDELPWLLLGVHSSTIDMRGRDEQLDESLGLNNAWYADILMVLTAH
ncbi:trypsin-like peptidase domain-containing protein [Paraburkholderia caballeronis]|uniref:Trypsin-like peptidase domain-containing protein n=1 Tax=Paraburkholderia caballeronis TaxID=416943 RepID=A0A1H7S6A1_9BURK|nr:trypsin-like peptidase domain-containing protein [Paraburkholderia caballeronis]PXW22906.1 trypsin-like peptidase [Paraburkholderia caballeronis]PXW97291.1 trypsin-like peptidase [Paraburkholderia caballeronis]RAJ93811.1 trypsin-like peptidase [Paraburkholderia caballeronis]SED57267.1 Trypsin-like peptidase domain-containing protein [Paraburkholderia caballeronis]SEL68023.1 Trypsin-like peptidase domain-containing protein [Paraburkholderia caballeronis]